MYFSDEMLIKEAQTGSRIAFERLMKRYERLVYKIAWSYTRQHDSALDVSQEIFIKVYRKLDTYRGTGAWLGWLQRVAHREGLTWIRRNRKYQGHTEMTQSNHPIQASGLEKSRVDNEDRHDLLEQLTKLNTRQQTAVSLRYFERRSIREIASVLECSESVAKNSLFRGLQKLRSHMSAG